MGKLAYKLHEASSVSGMEYPELADELNCLNEEKNKSKSDLLEKERQIKKAHERLEEKLDEAKVTEKKLDTYLNDKSMLKAEGLYIDDIARTSRVVKEFREKEFDPNMIIEKVQKHDSLTTEIKRLEIEVKKLVQNKEEIEKDITTLFNKKKEYEEEIIGLKNESKKLHEPFKALKELNSRNLYNNDILNLRDLVAGVDYTVEELKSSLTEMGGLEKLRDEKHGQLQGIEARITTLNKRAEGIEQDIKALMDRKNTISEDTQETIREFKAEMLSITSLFYQITNDPEKGLKANFIGLVESSLEEADTQLKKFEARAMQRMKSMEDAAATNERVAELGEKMRAYKIDFSNYRTLENLARLFLGMEVKRGEKLLLITSTLETLEDALNYMGLNTDANNLRRVKENVYRSAGTKSTTLRGLWSASRLAPPR